MKLPDAENAIIDLRKLTDYCLNPDHPRGKHKAQVFESALGLTAEDAEILRDALLQAVQAADAIEGEHDEYGQRDTIDFEMIGHTGQATIRSVWIIRTDENFPRLVSCFVR